MGLIKLEPAVLRRAAKDLNQSISQLGSVNNLISIRCPGDRIQLAKRVYSGVSGMS